VVRVCPVCPQLLFTVILELEVVMKRKCLWVLAVFAMYWSGYAHSGAYCSENITNVILHVNGNVYFTTDKTCPSNWCQINWGTSSKSAYATLLAARVTAKPVSFYWPDLTDCTQINVVYASPNYFQF